MFDSTRKPEFQAIILSGNGSRLYPLTEDIPKALLPIANKPLVYYTLKWLEQARVNDIIIVTHPSWRQKISHYISKVYEFTDESSMNVQTVEVPEGSGSCDALRAIQHKIKTDFIVLSADFITDTPPHVLFDSYRTLNPTVAVLFYDATKLASGSLVDKKDDDNTEYIGLEDDSCRFLFTASKADLDEDLEMRTSLLEKYPRIHLYSQLRDAHVYIFKKWIIDVIVKKTNVSSVRLDLIPLLLTYQYRPESLKKEGIVRHEESLQKAYELSPRKVASQGVYCSAIVCREDVSTRSNTRSSYAEMNRYMIKSTPKGSTRAEISPKTQVGPDSMVGEGSKIEERCSVKKSVIGAHCSIGKGVKISNCVIMDHVTIEDNVNLNGCIVCNNAIIQQNANLKDCDVGSKFVVDKDLVAKNESLV